MTMREKIALAISDTEVKGGPTLRQVFTMLSETSETPWIEGDWQRDMLTIADAVLDAMRESADTMAVAYLMRRIAGPRDKAETIARSALERGGPEIATLRLDIAAMIDAAKDGA